MYFALLIVLALGVLIPTLFMSVSYFLGPRKPSAAKSDAYECGIVTHDEPRRRFSVKFYLVAVCFLLFDVEVAFLYPWAVMVRPLGMWGICVMFSFVAVLLGGLVYLVRRGGLEWD